MRGEKEAWGTRREDPGPGPAQMGPSMATSCEDQRPPGVAFPVGSWSSVLVLILAATVYVDSLSYQFVWDDVWTVVTNQKLQDLRNLAQFFREDLTTLTSGAIEGKYYRPVMATSLAVDATLWGLNPAAFHLTNILLHVAVTFLVARLLRAWGAGRDTALLAALLFGIHPVHVEVVTFVTQRLDLWLSIGVLACLLSYRRSGEPGRRRITWYLAALGAQALALFSKEVAVTLPALLILSDALVSASRGHPAGREAWRRAVIRSLPFWAMTVTFVIFRLPTLQQLTGNRLNGFELWRRLPGASETLARYVWMLLVPTHMQPLYDLLRPTSFLALWPMLGLLSGAGLLALLLWWWQRHPLLAFTVAWLIFTMIPVVDIVPLSFREMGLADRYLYLPSVGFSILLALGLTRLMGPITGGSSPWRRRVAWTALIFLLILYPYHLLRYAPVWRNNLSLYGRMEQVAPRSPASLFNLGLAYLEVHNLPRATTALERAVRLDPTAPRPRVFLGLVYVLQGRARDGFRIFDTVASAAASEPSYYVARTKAHLFVGQSVEAVAVAEEGARRFPGGADLTQWLGHALDLAGRSGEAVGHYRQALALGPDMFLVEDALGRLLVRLGRPAEAAEHFRRSAEIAPDRVDPIWALACLREAQGNKAESLRFWRQVLEMAPNGLMIREAARHIRRLEREEAGTSGSPEGLCPSGALGP